MYRYEGQKTQVCHGIARVSGADIYLLSGAGIYLLSGADIYMP